MGQNLARALKALLALIVAITLAWLGARWLRPAPSTPVGESGGGSVVASLRTEPGNYNRLIEPTAAGDVVSLLIDGRLLRVNRATDEIELGLAESASQSPDGLTHTLQLRRDVRFSDGTPFTSEDVLFSARVAYDPEVNSNVGKASRVAGERLLFTADGPHAVKVTLPAPFAPGLRLLDNLPILPKHKLEAAYLEGRIREVWKAGTPASEIVGLGPFALAEHAPAQRMVFKRNPHYWKKDEQGVQLPYLDELTVLIIPDQNTEALRLESGETDLLANADIRAEDHAAFRRAAEAGRLRLIDVGIGLDPNLLWFNLSPTLRADAPYIKEAAFRQALSHAIDRQAIVDTVYLGEAVPIFGPVTPGNKTWYADAGPAKAPEGPAKAPEGPAKAPEGPAKAGPHQTGAEQVGAGFSRPYDPARARELLASIGLTDKNGDGTVDDRSGKPVRFSIVTQKGHTVRERTTSVVQEQLRQAGITIDIIATDPKSLFETWSKGAYDAMLFGIQSSSSDPTAEPSPPPRRRRA